MIYTILKTFFTKCMRTGVKETFNFGGVAMEDIIIERDQRKR